MSFDISFDTDDLVAEIEDDIARIVRENTDDLVHIDPDDFVRDDDLDRRVANEAESLLDSFPVEYGSRCSLGRSFTDAVYAVLADVIRPRDENCPNETSEQLRQVLLGFGGVVIESHGDVCLNTYPTPAVESPAESTEAWCVQQRDAYGKTVGIHGPFGSYYLAVVWSDAHPNPHTANYGNECVLMGNPNAVVS